jgi:tRNA (Thr-GGU) A37 N-methylase
MVIGVVRSGYTTTEQTPIQSSLNRVARATVELRPLCRRPVLPGGRLCLADHVAASAARPYPRSPATNGNTIHFAGVDLLDGTPVLNIKPYVSRFDRPAGQPRCGWFDDVNISDGSTPAGLPPPGPEA